LKAVNFGRDVPYLLSLTPSVTMTSDAGNGIGYTSLRVRGTDPSRINITANGIPMNDAESAQLYWVNMGDFASSVQSMQIQRGVGTSTNGAGAFGATLNMLTENIGMEPYLGLDFSGGSYYSHKETLRFGTGLLSGHWGIQGRLSDIGSKGYLDRASTKLNSYFIQAGYFSDNTVVKLITWNGIEKTYHAWNYTSKYEQSLYGRTYNSCGEY
jgi:iron complex outermembrane receptor protein